MKIIFSSVCGLLVFVVLTGCNDGMNNVSEVTVSSNTSKKQAQTEENTINRHSDPQTPPGGGSDPPKRVELVNRLLNSDPKIGQYDLHAQNADQGLYVNGTVPITADINYIMDETSNGLDSYSRINSRTFLQMDLPIKEAKNMRMAMADLRKDLASNPHLQGIHFNVLQSNKRVRVTGAIPESVNANEITKMIQGSLETSSAVNLHFRPDIIPGGGGSDPPKGGGGAGANPIRPLIPPVPRGPR
ncbi:MAG: hypothetical protein KY468_04900 [Armatimonadetes bacterium]|nr:hypothetical protein [Armatimonadota bacterium]